MKIRHQSKLAASAIFFAVVVGMASAVQAGHITDNLVLYLNASNTDGAGTVATSATGTAWSDLSGSGNNATLNNTAWGAGVGVGTGTIADPYGMRFDPTSAPDYLDFALFGLDENSMSMEFYLRMDATQGPGGSRGVLYVEESGTGQTKNLFQVLNASGFVANSYQLDQFPATGSPGAATGAANAITLNDWQQFVVTKDGTDVRVYVNGDEIASHVMAETYSGAAPTTVVIGTRLGVPTHSFGGDIGIVRLYGDALTAAEVLQNYNTIAIPEPTSLILVGLGGVLMLARRRRSFSS